MYSHWAVCLSLGCGEAGYGPLSCLLSVFSDLYDLTCFLIHNRSFKRAYETHAPQRLPACPQGGRFSCFSLMEKAMAMKFPLTADPVTPCKRSALHNAVNRWGWRTGYNTDDVWVWCVEEESHSFKIQMCVIHACFLGCHTSELKLSVWQKTTSVLSNVLLAFIQPQPGTYGLPALAERVKVSRFSCRAALEEARVTSTTQSTKRSLAALFGALVHCICYWNPFFENHAGFSFVYFWVFYFSDKQRS